jgi:GTP-binding protein
MSNFIDYVKIHCASGKGGAGSQHMFRAKGVPKGGPDGGDGGRGGHIILRGNKQMWTLLPLKYKKHVAAEAGTGGSWNNQTGAEGKDVYLDVPLGTIARDADTEEIIAEISEDKQEIILFEGGKGGKGNKFFATPTLQAPRFAQPGMPSKEGWVILELKVLADVGLVGFPNAGKSTLLSVVTAAKPEIADYPFTTLTPNLGIVAYRDYRSFVMADIPGIIEGAHLGKGLGIQFLKHIERNSLLLFVVQSDVDSVFDQYQILLRELKEYNPELLDKPRILAISKSDLIDDELKEDIEKRLPDIPHVFISAVAQTGLMELKDLIWKELHK